MLLYAIMVLRGYFMKKMFFVTSLLLYALSVNAQGIPMLTDDQEAPMGGGIVIAPEDMDFSDHEDAFGNEIKIMPQVVQSQGRKKSQNDDTVKLNTKKSLTDNFKDNASEDDEEYEDEEGKSWVSSGVSALKNAISTSKGSKDNALATMLEQSKGGKKRSNAAVFDISGVMLTMTYAQAEAALTKRGYKKISQKLEIPNFIKWRNEEACRNNGVVGYERLNNCVVKLARKGKYEYIAQTQFNNFSTKETVTVYLTSNFTGNKVYKVTYRTEAANIAGNNAKSKYLRNIKVFDFWKKISQKYGEPDNKQDVIWGLGGNKPYLRAATGLLLLENKMLKELDYTRMSREDQRFLNTDTYTF